MNVDPRDEVDSILDVALREYSNREPRDGLDDRILRHIHTVPRARRYWRAGWALAAVVLAVIVSYEESPGFRPLPEISHVAEPPVQPTPLPPPPRVQTIGKTAIKGRELPKRDRFPEPQPLTSEERVLLHLVETQPEKAREALARSEEIEELTIEPLEIEELQ